MCSYSPSVVVHNAHGAMNLRAQNTNSKFRLASTSLRMSSEPPADEQGDTVDISVEELRELATKAGVNVKFASEMREQQSAPGLCSQRAWVNVCVCGCLGGWVPRETPARRGSAEHVAPSRSRLETLLAIM
eukprot:2923818-Rhodomonas_salina.1